ncbi:hypothetical protein KZZ52_30595 [Dactylosporangium sp. AC04546]|uniref:hypothetical protein n=1 Tax=Dactylosporangium sp. AC04546 TaxID=2862460 RepID=UPI001EDD5217|nr:hypothetical protein [Dactylosporangium sp. AC04546]WVK78345.1 hypothetical protein KZZ52_30595 [Dactylosporangium sp. AC04546]
MTLTRRTALIAIGYVAGFLVLWGGAHALNSDPGRRHWLATSDGPLPLVAGLGVVAMNVAPFAVMFAAAPVYLWLSLGWRRPARLDIAGGAFVARPAHGVVVAGGAAALGFLLLSIPVRVARAADGLTPIVLMSLATCLLCCAWVAVCVAALVRDGGRIELHPGGLRSIGALSETFVPWEAVAAGPLRGMNWMATILGVNRPDLVRRRGLALRSRRAAVLATNLSAVDGRFLAGAVTYYVANPAERAAIGTPAGYRRLVAAISGPRS